LTTTPARIHLIGGSGSGKTTLARRLGDVLAAPVHHLDDLFRVGGGAGPVRPAPERDALVARILAQPSWIVEGIHVGWTDPILRAADVIVWLDHLPAYAAQRRVFARFVRDAVAEARRRRGRDRFLRVRDYARQLSVLRSHLRRLRDYDRADADPGSADGETRSAIASALEEHRAKLVHCTSQHEVDAFVRQVTIDSRSAAMSRAQGARP